ncbi:MAG TPA: RdgB/HAM1 family non-canonical purine NTP pyrophosphatase [Clostridia bacterium]|nr:RdgB/HAM1 family non-canonical purine NTP pyrophosphatase [Clostridia bacterium]
MKLLIASNNAHKTAEIRTILGGCFDEILSLKEAGLDIDVVEDGETFEANAQKKAEEVLRAAGDIADAALSDDSGLMVDALGGAPGVYSARYAGEGHDDAANNRKLLAAMRDVPDDARSCRFVSAVALARKGKETLVVRGTAEGTLLYAYAGGDGFGYDPLFYYAPLDKSFAQMSAAEKNEVSHRRRALNALRDALEAERNGR